MKSLISALLVIPTFAQINPDLILTHGKIWTVDPSNSVAEAVACRAGRILAVGRASQIEKLAGPHTRIIHLNGRLVVPGFNDAHVHFYTGGADLASVQLRDARSESEFRSRIAAFATTLPPGRWITGGNWDHESWSPPRLPARQLIDASSAGHPVFVRRLDGHMALANSEALRLAGIDRNTPDPPGGTIVRDAGGEPSGILKDAAMEPVERVIPPPSQAEIVEALRAAMRHASEYGVTSVQDMSASPEILRAYQKLLR
jgi:predicted amidohydrolase YtcJ